MTRRDLLRAFCAAPIVRRLPLYPRPRPRMAWKQIFKACVVNRDFLVRIENLTTYK